MKIELSGHYGYRRIVKTMAPMVLMMLVTSVYSIVDGFFVSNFAGSNAFAGMNLIWPAFALVGALGIMIGSGGSALVAKTLGEGEKERASRIFSSMIRLTSVLGIITGAILFAFMPQVVRWLGSDAVMEPFAISYGRILTAFLPCYMLQMAFQPFYMVAELPQIGTRMSIICGVANIVLDAVFVAGLGWGLNGAAVATVISFLVGAVVPLWFFASRRNRTHLRLVRGGTTARDIIKSCINGMSEFVGNIALNVVGICYNWQLMKYIGAFGVDAYGIVMYLAFIFAAVFIGYNMGISQVISFNYGAGNTAELRSLLHKSLVLIGIGGTFMTVLAETSAPLLARIFVGYDRELCSLTVHATRIYMLSFIICGFNMFTSAWFTALNNGIVSAVAAFVRTLVFELSAVFILPSVFGIDGIWYSINAAEIMSLVLSFSLIFGFRRRYGLDVPVRQFPRTRKT